MFVQIFKSLKNDMKTYESCEWNADLFKGCKHLNLINEEDFFKLMCENYMYTDNCFYVIRTNK